MWSPCARCAPRALRPIWVVVWAPEPGAMWQIVIRPVPFELLLFDDEDRLELRELEDMDVLELLSELELWELDESELLDDRLELELSELLECEELLRDEDESEEEDRLLEWLEDIPLEDMPELTELLFPPPKYAIRACWMHRCRLMLPGSFGV
jgi:hypothetical protein